MDETCTLRFEAAVLKDEEAMTMIQAPRESRELLRAAYVWLSSPPPPSSSSSHLPSESASTASGLDREQD